jgi:signal transduction histidine kinase
VKTIIFFFIVIVSLNSGVLAQSKKTIDSLRAKLPEIVKNDTTFFTANSLYLVDYYLKNNIDSAIYFIEKSIEICQRRNWQESEIQLMNQLAYAFQSKGLVYKAIDTNYKALIKAEKINKPELTIYIKRSLGSSYYDLKQYNKAKEMLNSAYILAKKYKDDYEQLAALNSLGNLEIELLNYKNAEKYYSESLIIAIKNKESQGEAIANHNLAFAKSMQGNIKEASPLFERSLFLHKKLNSEISIAKVYVDMGIAFFNQKEFKKSLELIENAIKISKKNGSNEVSLKAMLWKYKNQKALGMHLDALKSYENYNEMNEIAQQEEVNKRINSLQLEYDLSQKETELLNKNLEIVKKDNLNLTLQRNRSWLILLAISILIVAVVLFFNRFKLRKINSELDQKVKERTADLENANQDLIKKNQEISEALFKGQTIERKRVAVELHDNLSSILSAIKMSFSVINIQNFNEKEKEIYLNLKEMLGNAYSEVRNISHNIMPEELEQKGLQVTIQNLVNKLNVGGGIIFTFENNIDHRLDTKFEVNLYGIIFELINNILKHSNASLAKISLNQEDTFLKLIVHDNGDGMKTNNAKGMGMKNIQNRIQAMNGTIDIYSKTNIGTEILISVPV